MPNMDEIRLLLYMGAIGFCVIGTLLIFFIAGIPLMIAGLVEIGIGDIPSGLGHLALGVAMLLFVWPFLTLLRAKRSQHW